MEDAMKWEETVSGRQQLCVEVRAFISPEEATETKPTPAWRWSVYLGINDDEGTEGTAATCAEARQQAEYHFLSALCKQLEKAEASFRSASNGAGGGRFTPTER